MVGCGADSGELSKLLVSHQLIAKTLIGGSM